MSKWVQHKSGQGEKYVAEDEDRYTWKVPIKERYSNLLRWDLPKSEYIEVSPPEQWEDVTAECEVSEMRILVHGHGMTAPFVAHAIKVNGEYRLRKVQNMKLPIDSSVFIVEKRKS